MRRTNVALAVAAIALTPVLLTTTPAFAADPIAQAWRAAGRPDLTTQAAERRLDAYLTTLLNAT